ncbi:hypothetical protein MGYG_01038 [Nannizzia gypsea CBS 118893]|uniref:L-ascorbic acid binding protein n=1 Tax=Arthroderma gypseum (strain ATCC MYA-4604 / CBS 118893) TaxID=535722 RepID=E5R3U2_ARTGP|nr:hypothetical protein MGYG_01038 [Nannizzia gypsea CBS 118893]EFQ98002.1 hypothetical protein MGYG_01038 [Nannizzia gypsea CBS 118893]
MALDNVETKSRVEKFEFVMERVYGNYRDVSDPCAWTPPPAPGGHRGRYLWTDAFGVINFLTLYKMHTELKAESGYPERYLTFAERLVDTVHDVLGRTRDGTSRLPGATDSEPLAGGLRIGKVDETGSDGDGQYHHYLTQWMFALNRLSMATGNPIYNRQACLLGKAIHPHFLVGLETDRPRMVWKVAMDLSRPLVSSEGNLDPLDGFVTFSLVQASAKKFGDGEVFREEISNYKKVSERRGGHIPSLDFLDLGMTLVSVQWFYDEDWAVTLASRCCNILKNLFDEEYHLKFGASRLAFREFGACLGIECFRATVGPEGDLYDYFKEMSDAMIEQYNDDGTQTPNELKPITRVMFASALIPGAFQAGFFGPEHIKTVT